MTAPLTDEEIAMLEKLDDAELDRIESSSAKAHSDKARSTTARLVMASRAVPRLIADLRTVTAERDRLKRREQDIIAATDPADGGQYRNDIAGAILRQRRELDEARAEIARLRAALAGELVDVEVWERKR